MNNDVSGSILPGRRSSQNRNNELGDAHPNSAPEEDRSSTPFFNGIKTWKSGGGIYTVRYQADDKRVGKTRVLEELGSILLKKSALQVS